MTPLPKPTSKSFFQLAINFQNKLFRPSQLYLNVQLCLFETYTEDTLKKMDQLQLSLWNQTTRRYLSCISPQASPVSQISTKVPAKVPCQTSPQISPGLVALSPPSSLFNGVWPVDTCL